jgi:hypothetical protein
MVKIELKGAADLRMTQIRQRHNEIGECRRLRPKRAPRRQNEGSLSDPPACLSGRLWSFQGSPWRTWQAGAQATTPVFV